MRIAVVITTREPHRQAEALRAALGLTLRGARVEVGVHEPLLTPLAQRAADTLRSFGHSVVSLADSLADGEPGSIRELLARADRVEVWT
jgi:sorbitol-specific phosphotransferase system component IIA